MIREAAASAASGRMGRTGAWLRCRIAGARGPPGGVHTTSTMGRQCWSTHSAGPSLIDPSPGSGHRAPGSLPAQTAPGADGPRAGLRATSSRPPPSRAEQRHCLGQRCALGGSKRPMRARARAHHVQHVGGVRSGGQTGRPSHRARRQGTPSSGARSCAGVAAAGRSRVGGRGSASTSIPARLLMTTLPPGAIRTGRHRIDVIAADVRRALLVAGERDRLEGETWPHLVQQELEDRRPRVPTA